VPTGIERETLIIRLPRAAPVGLSGETDRISLAGGKMVSLPVPLSPYPFDRFP